MVTFIDKLYNLFLASDGVSIDSRKITPNCLFFALKGDNFDGNQYAQQALEKGARYAVIDDPKKKISKRYVLVDNVLKTMQLLASYHRNKIDIPVLAITGSNGKTTTKELLKRVLSQKYILHATEGNFNNHIGVPLTLLRMPRDTEFAVIEMGASAQNEIKQLCEIAAPNYGLVTNVGQAHLEGFGGLEGVKKGKGELFDYLSKKGGLVFYNEDEPYLAEMSSSVPSKVAYGQKQRDFTIGFLEVQDVSNEKVIAVVPEAYWGYRIFSSLSGDYNFENVKTAIAVGKYFKLNFAQIKYAIESYVPQNMRSQSYTLGDNFVFLDAYNANPSSMKRALADFAKRTFEQSKKIAVLGDMLELGAFADGLHKQILEFAESLDLSAIYLVGDHFAKANKSKHHQFKDVGDLTNWLAQKKEKNVAYFVKGSRGIKLEKAFLADSTQSI